MSVNKNRPHVFVLPEDDANRQLANEFHLQIDPTRQRQMQILKVAGGWNQVCHLFQTVHVAEMDRNQYRSMVLLIDFDGHGNRLQQVQNSIPDRLRDRVFILGAWTNPEMLRANLGSYQKI